MMTPPMLNYFYLGDLLFLVRPISLMDQPVGSFAIVWKDQDSPEPKINVVFEDNSNIIGLSPEDQEKHFVCFRRDVLKLSGEVKIIFRHSPGTLLNNGLPYLKNGFAEIALGPDNDNFVKTEETSTSISYKVKF